MTRFIVFMLSVLSLLAGLGGFVTAVQGEQIAVPISQQELLRHMASPVDQLILDVRTPMEFRAGHVPGAINIPRTPSSESSMTCCLGEHSGEMGKALAGCRSLR